MRLAGVLLVTLALQTTLAAQSPNWGTVDAEALKTLQSYIRINTSVPPGDVTKAADLLVGILEREGITVKRFESGPGRSIVMARLKGTGPAKPLMLLHHMDVVPADASRWARDPFGGEIADGRIWGRGALDMKGPGVAQLYAFIMLKRQNIALDRDIILMAVPDEEVGGGLGATWMREQHYAEFEPEYILDEGGFGSRDLFAPGKLVFGISVAEKKLIWLKVTARRRRGPRFAATRQEPQRPTRPRAGAAPQRAHADVPIQRARYAEITVGALAENKFNNAIQHSTISITTLRAGVGDPPKANVIPSIAEASLDCRVLPGTSKEQWLAEIARRLGDPGIKLEVLYESPDPVVTTTDSAFYRALEGAVKRQYPEAIVTPTIVPYATDSNGFRPRGVKSYGFTPAILPAEVIASMHGDAEYVPVDVIGPAIRILYEALVTTAGKR